MEPTKIGWKDADAVIVAGATASGKSAFAIALAQAMDAVIINADALQLYADLDVLSARPNTEEMRAVPHALYGTLAADEAASAGRWLELAVPAINAAIAAGRKPLIVGGTGLYIKTLREGISPIPNAPEQVRRDLEAELAAKSLPTLYAELETHDPTLAQRLKPNDTQRILRGLEIFRATNIPLSQWQATPAQPPLPHFNFYTVEITRPREELYARCDLRVDVMMKSGAIAEVERLLAMQLPNHLPIMRAVGVPELAAYLRSEMSYDEAVEKMKQMTRNYAKRQLTWLRNQWVANATVAPENILDFLNH